MHENLVNIGRVVLEISVRTDRQTNKQTIRQNGSNTPLRYWSGVINATRGKNSTRDKIIESVSKLVERMDLSTLDVQ